MRIAVFVLAAAVALTLDASLMPALTLGGAAPSMVGALAAFVALHAERRTAWWACWTLGLLLDLSNPMPVAGAATFVPGPFAVGFTLGAALILGTRAEIARRSFLANGAATLALLLMASVFWTGVWMVRGWWPDGEWVWAGSALGELGRKAWWSLWSAVVAMPLSLLLGLTFDRWGFAVSWRSR